MKHEFPRAPGAKKMKCSACGHLHEKHTRFGRCTAQLEVWRGNWPWCRCQSGIKYRKGEKHVYHRRANAKTFKNGEPLVQL